MKSITGRTKSLDAYARSDRKCNDQAVHMPHPHERWDAKASRMRYYWCSGVLMPTVLLIGPEVNLDFKPSAPVPGDFVMKDGRNYVLMSTMELDPIL